MNAYKMILRKENPPNTLLVEADFCEANTVEEARVIFEARHGNKRNVAGPFKVDSSEVPKN